MREFARSRWLPEVADALARLRKAAAGGSDTTGSHENAALCERLRTGAAILGIKNLKPAIDDLEAALLEGNIPRSEAAYAALARALNDAGLRP